MFVTKRLLVAMCLPFVLMNQVSAEEEVLKHEKAFEKKEGMEFIEKKSEGWFFYKDLPPEVKERIRKEALKEMKQDEPPVGSTKWLEKNLPDFRARAQDNASEANIKAYLLMERLATEKAKRYALMTQKVVQDNPYLNFRTFAPGTIRGDQAARFQTVIETEKLAKKISQRVATWFFFNGGDRVAAEQAMELNKFKYASGMESLNVSLNGEPLEVNGFEKFEKDNGISREFKLQTTPALILFDSKTGEYVPFIFGTATKKEMLDRLIAIAHQQEWITEEEYQSTKVMKKKPIEKLLDANLAELNELSKDPEGFVNRLEEIMGVAENEK